MTNHTLQKQLIQGGAALAGAAVALGAFGAHKLKDILDEASISAFETAVRYQFYHAIGLLAIGGMLRRLDEKTAKRVAQLFILGIIIFCGSLYIVSTRGVTFGDGVKWMGGLTPVGGASFIAGWVWLAYKGYKPAEIPGSRSRSRSREKENATQDNTLN